MAWRIKFGADRTLPIAEVTDSPVAIEADVPDGGLIVFAEDGRLSCLEYWTTTDDVPAGFPPPEHIALCPPESAGIGRAGW
ncbi:hypothetical protein [Amycolatopsis sp. Hca4]|uniref:hypothetical protein n=1 Tax=Amycolatopsis sp. Hca4 TaxID=2742131 RepID=UPI0020CAD31F|nr:hypothetical protein [Amycolatopsis sp. Hca4]